MKSFAFKIIYLLIALSAFQLSAFAQSLFSSAYGTPDFDEIHDAEKSADGRNYFLAGISSPVSGDLTSFLIKMDTSGNIIWKRNYSSLNHDVRFDRVFENSNGELIITGMFILGKQCGLFMRTDSSGNILQLKRYKLNADHKPTIVTREVVETNDHGYAMIGYAGFGFNDWKLLWMRVDSSGNPLFDHQYGNARDDHPIALFKDDSDGFYMITRVGNSFNDHAGFVRAYHLSATGQIFWSRNIVPSFAADLTSCSKTADGNYILAGNSPDSSYIMKLNADFDVVWIRNYSPAYFQSITIDDEDNSIWLTGRKYPGIGILNTITKTNSDGVILYSKEINNYCSAAINYDYYFSIARSNVLCFHTKNIFTGYFYDCGIDTPNSDVSIMSLTKNSDFACSSDELVMDESLGQFPEILYQSVEYNDSVDFNTIADSIEDFESGNVYTLCDIANDVPTIAYTSDVSIFPNPTCDQLNIEWSQAIQYISVVNALGEVIYRASTQSSTHQINCSKWSRGIYLLIAKNESGRSIRLPFIVN